MDEQVKVDMDQFADDIDKAVVDVQAESVKEDLLDNEISRIYDSTDPRPRAEGQLRAIQVMLHKEDELIAEKEAEIERLKSDIELHKISKSANEAFIEKMKPMNVKSAVKKPAPPRKPRTTKAKLPAKANA